MLIKNLGADVAGIWDDLRPATKRMLAGALKTGKPVRQTNQPTNFHYDAHADWELSRLLGALDESQWSKASQIELEQRREAAELAEMCAAILEQQSGSAEVFIQLARRAIYQSDYDRLETLADTLYDRFSPAEIAEVVRQTDMPQIRAIAFETLAMLPVEIVAPLLDDQLYSEIAFGALEQKAIEFDSEEARDLLDQFEGISGATPI